MEKVVLVWFGLVLFFFFFFSFKTNTSAGRIQADGH